MPLVLDELVLKFDLFLHHTLIYQRLVPISSLHCLLGILAGLDLEADELECVLLAS